MRGYGGRRERRHQLRQVSGGRQKAQSERGDDERGGDRGDMKRQGCTFEVRRGL